LSSESAINIRQLELTAMKDPMVRHEQNPPPSLKKEVKTFKRKSAAHGISDGMCIERQKQPGLTVFIVLGSSAHRSGFSVLLAWRRNNPVAKLDAPDQTAAAERRRSSGLMGGNFGLTVKEKFDYR